VGNGAQNHLPDAAGGDRKKDDAGEKDCAEGCLPRDVHLEADGVGEVRVEAHAGRECYGVARDDSHQNRTERGREAGGCCGRGQRNAGGRENGRIDQHDISHGQERCDASEDFGAPVSSQMGKFEVSF
jgi:hypothetical protein